MHAAIGIGILLPWDRHLACQTAHRQRIGLHSHRQLKIEDCSSLVTMKSCREIYLAEPQSTRYFIFAASRLRETKFESQEFYWFINQGPLRCLTGKMPIPRTDRRPIPRT